MWLGCTSVLQSCLMVTCSAAAHMCQSTRVLWHCRLCVCRHVSCGGNSLQIISKPSRWCVLAVPWSSLPIGILGTIKPSVSLNHFFLLYFFEEQGKPYSLFPWEALGDAAMVCPQRSPCSGWEAGKQRMVVRGLGMGGLENSLMSQGDGRCGSAPERAAFRSFHHLGLAL